MASTYVNNLRLNEMATGDASGTWGTTTNTNLELIGEALGYGTEAITTNADTHTSTVADGASDAARAMYVKYTGTLDSACTITIAPNTMKRVQIIENATSGSQSIIIKQGSGSTVTIPTGRVAVVYLDGAGSGGAVVNAFTDLDLAGTLSIAGAVAAATDMTVGDDLTLSSDAGVLGFGADTDVTLTHVADTGLLLNSSRQLQFGDSGTYIHQSADGVLDLVADTEIEINATTIDINGAVDISGNALVSGEVQTANIGYTDGDNAITIADGGGITAANGITSTAASNTFGATSFNDADITNVGSIALDTITNDGTDITIDSSGDIILDAGGADVMFKDDGTEIGLLANTGSNFIIMSRGDDKDIIFKGVDSTSTITALTLDMSEAGEATFNDSIHVNGPSTITTANNLDTLSLISTDADAAVGPVLDLYRNSGSPADDDFLGKINFRGRNDNSQDVNYGYLAYFIADASDGTEDAFMQMGLMKGGSSHLLMEATSTETVFNQGSVDQDFRVESDGQTHALFVDGALDNIGIGYSAAHTATNKGLVILTGDGNGGIQLNKEDGSNPSSGETLGSIGWKGQDSANSNAAAGASIVGIAAENFSGSAEGTHLAFNTKPTGTGPGSAPTQRMRINADGNVGINSTNPQTKFVVQHTDGESGIEFSMGASLNYIQSYDRNASDYIALKLDGEDIRFGTNDGSERMRILSDGKVGIGTSSPTAKLDVRGSVNSEHVVITGGTNAARGLSIQTEASGGQQDAGVVFDAQDTEAGAAPFHKFETAGAARLTIESQIVKPSPGTNVGSVRNEVTISTSATTVLNMGALVTSGDIAKGRYLITVSRTAGTVGTAASSIFGLSSSGAIYEYETINSNSMTLGVSGGNVTATAASGSYAVHANALPLSVDS
jgi:hypothetical protein